MKLGSWVVMLLVMMMFLEFTGIPTGISAGLADFGISINTNTDTLLTTNLGNSPFWQKLFLENSGILVVILTGAVLVVGLFTKSFSVELVILPIITFTASLLITTFSAIILYAVQTHQGWIIALVGTIFAPLAAGFIWSCVDYFGGR